MRKYSYNFFKQYLAAIVFKTFFQRKCLKKISKIKNKVLKSSTVDLKIKIMITKKSLYISRKHPESRQINNPTKNFLSFTIKETRNERIWKAHSLFLINENYLETPLKRLNFKIIAK